MARDPYEIAISRTPPTLPVLGLWCSDWQRDDLGRRVRREFPDAPIVGVGAVVLDRDRVLLIRRGRAPLKNEWSIPGGAVELGETLREAIRREVFEETGVDVKVLGMVDVLDRIVLEDVAAAPIEAGSGVGRVRYHYVLIDFLCLPAGGSLGFGSDAADARWVARGDLGAYALAPATLAVLDKAFAMAGAGVRDQQ
jgi:ADP-ribose pyrophosphatase YjhB (NUDIX family)